MFRGGNDFYKDGSFFKNFFSNCGGFLYFQIWSFCERGQEKELDKNEYFNRFRGRFR
jgi:hypothetical protein